MTIMSQAVNKACATFFAQLYTYKRFSILVLSCFKTSYYGYMKQNLLYISLLSGVVAVTILGFIFITNRSNITQDESKTNDVLASISSQSNIPIYDSADQIMYRLNNATKEKDFIFSSYRSDKGEISVTQQPTPSTDPFLLKDAADTFTTPIGEAKIYPDNQGNPYVVIDAPLSWVIVRSRSESISSADLKRFSISLEQKNLSE